MKLEKIIKDNDFRTYPIKVFNKDDEFLLKPIYDKEYRNFNEMKEKRNEKRSISQVIKEIYNKNLDKHEYANVGVSGLFILEYKNDLYMLLVPQNEKAKLLSGYIPSENIDKPLSQLEIELSEEFLPYDNKKEKFIPFDNKKPYKLPYDNKEKYTIEKSKYNVRKKLLNLSEKEIYIIDKDNKKTKLDDVSLYLFPQTNSLQLVYEYIIKINSKDKTFHHAEDYYNTKKKELETLLKENDIILAEIDKSKCKLTGNFYRMIDGNLEKRNDIKYLSEVFDIDNYKGVSFTRNNSISVEKYLINNYF